MRGVGRHYVWACGPVDWRKELGELPRGALTPAGQGREPQAGEWAQLAACTQRRPPTRSGVSQVTRP